MANATEPVQVRGSRSGCEVHRCLRCRLRLRAHPSLADAGAGAAGQRLRGAVGGHGASRAAGPDADRGPATSGDGAVGLRDALPPAPAASLPRPRATAGSHPTTCSSGRRTGREAGSRRRADPRTCPGRMSGRVFGTHRAEVLLTPVQAPNANAHAERWIRTVRAECLDWLLIVGRGHLEQVLRVYVEHYNG